MTKLEELYAVAEDGIGKNWYADPKTPDVFAKKAVDALLEYEDWHDVIYYPPGNGDRIYSIQHPLRERLAGTLFDCTLADTLNEMNIEPGRYRVYRDMTIEARHE